MKINIAKELKKAREGHYAIGAFNTANMEATKAICAAAREMNTPVIIQTTPSTLRYAGLPQIYAIVMNEIAATGIKAVIHLDHGKDWQTVKACIDIGYQSVMIDGSKLPYEDNVTLTKKVVDYAHERDCAVEAEFGILGSEEGESKQGKTTYSSPKQTLDFVKATGVDSIAVAIGNAHGAPSGEEIDLPLLEEIAKVVKIPIVIHGSSGLSNHQIKSAIEFGVAKLNVDTRLRQAFLDGIRHIDHDETDYRNPLTTAIEEMKAVVKDRIRTFGTVH